MSDPLRRCLTPLAITVLAVAAIVALIGLVVVIRCVVF